MTTFSIILILVSVKEENLQQQYQCRHGSYVLHFKEFTVLKIKYFLGYFLPMFKIVIALIQTNWFCNKLKLLIK